MPTSTETFDLQATVNMVGHAFVAVICNIGFQVATAGLSVAIVLALSGFICLSRGRRPGKPLLAVSRKIAIVCAGIGLPGLITLLTRGALPAVNQLVLNPFGLIGFWGLVAAHMCMEEMNFQWYADK
ncbi:MAG TPA: hypothetical protein V6D22_23275 [Candidatus Obscuribacterales bacterium]